MTTTSRLLLFSILLFNNSLTEAVAAIHDDMLSGIRVPETSRAHEQYPEMVLMLVQQNAAKFVKTENDCRVVPNGPRVSLAPEISCKYVIADGGSAYVEFFRFATSHVVLQITREKNGVFSYYQWRLPQ